MTIQSDIGTEIQSNTEQNPPPGEISPLQPAPASVSPALERWRPALADFQGTRSFSPADRVNQARRLVHFADFLLPSDASLIRAVYQDHMDLQQLAVLLQASPSTLRTRLRRLIRRVSAPEFAIIVASLDHFVDDRARVARACLLAGLTLRAASSTLNLSIHAVRTHRSAVLAHAQTVLRAHQAAPGPSSSWPAAPSPRRSPPSSPWRTS